MQFLQQARLQVKTDLGALAEVLSWFDQFAEAGIPHIVWMQCQLALAEGFTNAVRHAHHNQPIDTPIEIEVTLLHQAIEIQIWDQGPEFDLKQCLSSMPNQVDRNAEGGRGLKLMDQVADELSYSRLPDQRNCLLIVKNYA